MNEIFERTLDAKEIQKAVCQFAKMSESAECKWRVTDDLKIEGVTIRQRGWNRIDGQTEAKDDSN